MNYLTIYTTRDRDEISVLKSLFEKEDIDFKVVEDKYTQSGSTHHQRMQVKEEDEPRASELLEQSGLLSSAGRRGTRNGGLPGKKWILFFLAVLILILVAIVITWIMNVG